MTEDRMRRNLYTRSGKLAVALACATALAGCVTLGPDYQRPDMT